MTWAISTASKAFYFSLTFKLTIKKVVILSWILDMENIVFSFIYQAVFFNSTASQLLAWLKILIE